jgi:hypothetical protein
MRTVAAFSGKPGLRSGLTTLAKCEATDHRFQSTRVSEGLNLTRPPTFTLALLPLRFLFDCLVRTSNGLTRLRSHSQPLPRFCELRRRRGLLPSRAEAL